MTRVARVGSAGVPPVNERELQAAVITLARSLGWGVSQPASKALALEAAQYGIESPTLDGLIFHPRYSLGSEPGWPDLTLIRRRDRRLVFAELKAEKGVVSPRQAEVLDLLRMLEDRHVDPVRVEDGTWAAGRLGPTIQVHVWRPSDLAAGTISEVLR